MKQYNRKTGRSKLLYYQSVCDVSADDLILRGAVVSKLTTVALRLDLYRSFITAHKERLIHLSRATTNDVQGVILGLNSHEQNNRAHD